jgi:hypothetical protein
MIKKLPRELFEVLAVFWDVILFSSVQFDLFCFTNPCLVIQHVDIEQISA